MVVASSMSPLASVSAALHSIIPAPVRSRSFLTIAAVISMPGSVVVIVRAPGGRPEGPALRFGGLEGLLEAGLKACATSGRPEGLRYVRQARRPARPVALYSVSCILSPDFVPDP